MRMLLASTVLAAAAATATSCTPPNSASWPPAPIASGATVTGTESSGDKSKAGGITHYADCTAADGGEFRVVIGAAAVYSAGQPCPAGAHLPTVRQENPALFDEIVSALSQPLPHNGGDANGPCGSWGTADKAGADQAQAAWQRCMADPQHHFH